jgi:hypothetical protein
MRVERVFCVCEEAVMIAREMSWDMALKEGGMAGVADLVETVAIVLLVFVWFGGERSMEEVELEVRFDV